MGRATRGVRGINLRDDDRLIGIAALDDEGDIMTVTENGYGKRTAVEEYRSQSRGGKGIINLKVNEKTGQVVGVKQVQPEDGMMLITQAGKLIRINVDGVSRFGRAAQGVRVMNLGSEDRLVAVAKIVERDDEESGDEAGEESPEEPMESVDTDTDTSDDSPVN